MEPEGTVDRPQGRGFAVAVALATFWFSSAIGSVAVRRWRRAVFWLVTEWLWIFVMVGGVHRGYPRAMWVGALGFLLWRLPAAIDAFRIARAACEAARWQTLVVTWLVLTVAAVGGLNAVKRSLIEAFKIPAASMIPTLEIGDRVMVDKRSRQPARGDVIVFEFPLDRSTTYVKRVVALGGDTVEVRGGKLIVNGKDVWRERVQNGCPEGSADSGRPCVIWEETFDDRRYQVAIEPDPVRGDLERRLVPRGSVFVLGDNRDNTSDSRVWGPVPLENVTGTVRFIYWSTDERGQTRWDRVDAPVR